MNKRKICVITGTRADYGLLYWIMKEIEEDQDLQLQLVITGMHLSPEFGLTYKIIEDDQFNIDAKVEMLLSSDTAVGVAKSIGLGVISFADTFDKLQPDMLLILGDRYEILAAAQAAMIAKIPIAHIAGGDTTEGAFDEAIRHSITKMSHLHFTTNDWATKRVRQLGENPDHIFQVGSPGIDQIKNIKLMELKELEEALDFKFREKNLLITFHPVTLDNQSSANQFQELLSALDGLEGDIGFLFTMPNSDNESRIIKKLIEEYVPNKPNAKAYISLGQLRYLSAIKWVDVVVGNSSSGLYEVPSFKKPTVNIGDRQKGRLQADSVINCDPTSQSVKHAIEIAFTLDCSETINPYGDGKASKRIISEIKKVSNPKKLLKKHFYEVEFSCKTKKPL